MKKVTLEQIEYITQKIVEEFTPEEIVLFGSYARGTPRLESDIDLLIIKDMTSQPYQREQELRRKLIGNGFPPLDLVVLTPKEIKEREKYDDFFLKEIRSYGKVMYHANK